MASHVKNGFYWALTALQMSQDNTSSDCDSNVLTLEKQNHHQNDLKASLNLTQDAENLKPTYSRDTVSDHCTFDSCWIIINNKVYDVTRFLRMHPGGEDIILEHGGCDATSVFIDKGHSHDAYDSLADYLIGVVTPEGHWPEKRRP